VRYVVAGLLCVITLSCREIEPYTESSSTTDYQFNGIVMDSSGIAIQDLAVSLYYYYDSVAALPTDTQQVIVTDSMKVVDITVFTLEHDFISTIFLGFWHRTGPIQRIWWDGLDWMYRPVGSGMYLIRYYIDTAVVKYSPVVLDGRRTDTTDRRGRFTIEYNNLPIGKQFDYYDSTGSFKAVYKILPMIKLKLQFPDRSAMYDSVKLFKDRVTNGTFIL